MRRIEKKEVPGLRNEEEHKFVMTRVQLGCWLSGEEDLHLILYRASGNDILLGLAVYYGTKNTLITLHCSDY